MPDTQSSKKKGLFGSWFVEASVHSWLVPRQGSMAEGQLTGGKGHGGQKTSNSEVNEKQLTTTTLFLSAISYSGYPPLAFTPKVRHPSS